MQQAAASSGTLIRGGLLMHLSPTRLERGDLRIAGGMITAVGQGFVPREDEQLIDATGMVVMPGLVVGHHHLYSALASSMPAPPRAPTNFHEILKLIWWRLDRALDMETVRLSGLAGSMEAARCGVTTIIDHHASPSCIDGSLDALEAGIDAVGLRGVLCYEVTERNRGGNERDAGLAESRRYAGRAKGPRFAAMVGAHAAFTISDSGLRQCAELAEELGTGVHIHVAEDPCDDALCREVHGAPLWQRLSETGLIRAGNIFGHGTHLSEAEIAEAGAAGITFAHNTRSNMNNGVGYAMVGAMLRHGSVLLGTDGIGSDLFEEFRAATFRSNDGHTGAGWDAMLSMLGTNAKLAGERLGVTLGKLEAGAQADLALLDLPPAMPDSGAGSVAGHLLFSLSSGHVRHTMVAGELVLKDRELARVDRAAARVEIAAALPKLWQRLPEE